MELSRANSCPAVYFRHQLQHIHFNIFKITQCLDHLSFERLREWLWQCSHFVVSIDHVQALSDSKRVDDLLDPWHEHLMQLFGAPHRKNECPADFFHILSIEFLQTSNHILFNVTEKEWRSVA